MDYIVPDYFRDEILYGELSEIIEKALLKQIKTFKFYPEFRDQSFDEILNSFKAYVCYQYLNNETEIEQALFLRMIKSSEPEIRLNGLIDEFISVCIFSQIPDECIMESINESRLEYLSILKNIFTKDFTDYSVHDEEYKKHVFACIIKYDTDIDPGLLLMLTKCVIVESKNSKDFDYEFTDVTDAVKYALNLYYEQSISYEDRKNEIEKAAEIKEIINLILEQNELSR